MHLAPHRQVRPSIVPSIAGNDPNGEHDFGSFEIADQKIFFKIDYYNLEMDGGSEDPADPAKTTRMLTVMKAEEY